MAGVLGTAALSPKCARCSHEALVETSPTTSKAAVEGTVSSGGRECVSTKVSTLLLAAKAEFASLSLSLSYLSDIKADVTEKCSEFQLPVQKPKCICQRWFLWVWSCNAVTVTRNLRGREREKTDPS